MYFCKLNMPELTRRQDYLRNNKITLKICTKIIYLQGFS